MSFCVVLSFICELMLCGRLLLALPMVLSGVIADIALLARHRMLYYSMK